MGIVENLRTILGDKHVLTGADAAPYGKDWTGQYISQPLAVLRPANTAEVSEILQLANETNTPVVPVGGNTGLVGGTQAPDGLMISLERLNQVREIRPDTRIAIVEAGVILSKLHDAAAEHDLIFPLVFGARDSAMIGGNLSTNAGGSNVVRYGNTRALCLGLEVVLADGRIMDLMSELRKDNTGYDLKDLFIGAEGTLGIITAAVLKLLPQPKAYATAMLAAASLPSALKLLNQLQATSGGIVEAYEFMPRSYLQGLKNVRPDLKPPLGYDQDFTILVELGATAPRDSTPFADGSIPVTSLLENALMEMIEAGLASDAVIAKSDGERQLMWEIRESAAEIVVARAPRVDTDVSVPLEKIETFLDVAHTRLKDLDPAAETATVAHLGDGNLHFTVYPGPNDAKHNAKIRALVDDTATELGGSFSAEHGIGLSKLDTMARKKDPVAVSVMRGIKTALDPKGIMNPGKTLPD